MKRKQLILTVVTAILLLILAGVLIFGCQSSIVMVKGHHNEVKEKQKEDTKLDDNAILEGLEAINPIGTGAKAVDNLTKPKEAKLPEATPQLPKTESLPEKAKDTSTEGLPKGKW